MPRPCVRGACGRFSWFGPVPGVVSLMFPPSRPACPALRVAGRPVRVSLTLARWYAIPRGLCVPRARSGCPSGSPRVLFSVCALALPRRPLRPHPLGGVACAPHAVPALGAGKAVPRDPCPSACPAPVPCSVWLAWGGAARSRFPPTWLGAVRPPWGGSVAFVCRGAGFRGGGGRPVRRAPRLCGQGGPVGRGVALPRFVPLPSLGRQQSGCHWRRSGPEGRGPHTTPVRVRPPSRGAICAAFWRVGAGSLVPRGSCGSRRLGRGGRLCSGSSLGRGEGGPSPLPRGVGAGAPAACGLVGGAVGGGPAGPPYPGGPLVVGALPPGVRVRSGSRGRPGRGGGWGAARGPLPPGPLQT